MKARRQLFVSQFPAILPPEQRAFMQIRQASTHRAAISRCQSSFLAIRFLLLSANKVLSVAAAQVAAVAAAALHRRRQRLHQAAAAAAKYLFSHAAKLAKRLKVRNQL